MENNIVDARGLSCPQPVLLVNVKLGELSNNGVIEVLVDAGVATENVSRLLKNKGYSIEISDKNGEVQIKGTKTS